MGKKPTIAVFCSCFSFLISCNYQIDYLPIEPPGSIKKNTELDKEALKVWQYKDVVIDTVPGISLNRAYNTILKKKTGKEVIIAIIDSEIDIQHKDLQQSIWKNQDEIPKNGLDDDNNGYVDDVYGWNFLGNDKGENSNFTSYEYVRIIKEFNKKSKNSSLLDSTIFRSYDKALLKYNAQMKFAQKDIDYANMLLRSMANVKNKLSIYFKDDSYTIHHLDSLKEVYPKDKNLQRYILIRSNFIKYGYSQEFMNTYKLKATERVNKLLNLEYNDRIIVGDNPSDLSDVNYGNNVVNGNVDLFTHGTEVSSLIANMGSKYIKIMSIPISPFGDEHDKDISLAIKYAVDNGAKVINMSFSKGFSIHKSWVDEAFKYAEKHNVLIVSSAGNSKYNLNKKYNYYPTDETNDNIEISDNFILVGGTTRHLNENIFYYNSNYGSKDIDVFAPGENIYVMLPKNDYKYNSGTSLSSSIVSGVAGLLYSYYPSLNVSEIKNIIMESGLKYYFNVKTPTQEDKSKTTPFNQLSKSGKVVNAYNAFVMAEERVNK